MTDTHAQTDIWTDRYTTTACIASRGKNRPLHGIPSQGRKLQENIALLSGLEAGFEVQPTQPPHSLYLFDNAMKWTYYIDTVYTKLSKFVG